MICKTWVHTIRDGHAGEILSEAKICTAMDEFTYARVFGWRYLSLGLAWKSYDIISDRTISRISVKIGPYYPVRLFYWHYGDGLGWGACV